jgi:hypothetical protein
MDPNRKSWNERQQALRQALARPEEHTGAIALFLTQHAMVHTAGMSQAGLWSFEDEACQGLSAEELRRIPSGQEHSIAWLLWHITRIEDVTLNLLVAGHPQLFWRDAWLPKLNISRADTGNATQLEDITALSVAIDLEALQAYRLAVGRSTREIVQNLPPGQLKNRVDPARLAQVSAEGAVVPAAKEILAYWGGLTISGLLLMPPTRHSFIHLNEALRVRQKMR